MNPACTWRFNAEYWGAIHSTKIPTGPTGKTIALPQKVDPFFRNFSGWTEPIHWVLDRNIPEILVEWIALLETGFQNLISCHHETPLAKIQGWCVPWKKNCSPFHLSCNWQWPLLLFKHWKIFINASFDMFKVQRKKRNSLIIITQFNLQPN